MRARAAVADGTGRFTIEDVEVADPGPGEVLVDIHASGICHTDHQLLHEGARAVLGHEGAGVVRAVGDGVTNVAPGDHVITTWSMSCGRCRQCMDGLHPLCERKGMMSGGGGRAHEGSTTWHGKPLGRLFEVGTLSTATVVVAEAVVEVDPSVPKTAACIVGCGVTTGYGSVVNVAKVPPGASVAVLGCGGVGLNAVQGARISGAHPIIAVDIDEARLETAKRFGATDGVLARRDDEGLAEAAAEVRRRTGGGTDFAFECTAVPALGFAPLAFVRHGGTAVQVSGVEQDLTVDMRLFEWDKTYVNPLGGRTRPAIDFPKVLALYQAGELLLDELVTRTYTLDELPLAFDDLLAGKLAKGVVVMDVAP